MSDASTPNETAPAPVDDVADGPGPAPAARPVAGRRVAAAVIDSVITGVVGVVPVAGGVAATAYWLVRDGLDVSFMDHRSIGKQLMKLRPVTQSGGPVDVATSIRRNWMFALGGVSQLFVGTGAGMVAAIPLSLAATVLGLIELVLVFAAVDGRRIGDRTGETHVICDADG